MGRNVEKITYEMWGKDYKSIGATPKLLASGESPLALLMELSRNINAADYRPNSVHDLTDICVRIEKVVKVERPETQRIRITGSSGFVGGGSSE